MQRTAEPFHVCLVEAEKCPKPVAGVSRCDSCEFQHFRHHKKHHEAAIGVDRDVALYRLWEANGFLRNARGCKGGLHSNDSILNRGLLRARPCLAQKTSRWLVPLQ